MANLAIQQNTFDHVPADKLTSMIMRLFEHWKLTYAEQAIMLGFSPKTHSTIARYKNGSQAIALDRDTYDRVRFLLSIHKNLRTIFPLNKDLGYAWVKAQNRTFDGKTPFDIIAQEGFLGLARVNNYLENYMAG